MTGDELLAQLRARGVERVEVEYDGYGDEGSLTSVELFGPSYVEIDTSHELWGEVDRAVCEVLSRVWPGWEVDDGSAGVVTITVPTGRIEVDHGQRYTKIDFDSYEGDL